MNDKELVTDAIYTMAAGDLDRDVAGMCADAVLAAFAGRIMPPIPAEVKEIHLYEQGDGTWSWGTVDSWGRVEVEEPCRTIPEAIANAEVVMDALSDGPQVP